MKTLCQAILILFITVPFSLSAQIHFEKDFQLAPDNSNFYNWVEIDGRMFFGANDSHYGQELWMFDPATEQAYRLTDINPQAGSSYPRGMLKHDEYIYFVAWMGPEDGQHLFRYSFDLSEPACLTCEMGGDFQPVYLALYADKIWFSAKEESISNLWNYDPSTETIEMIAPPADAHPDFFWPQLKYAFDGKLYVNAFDADLYRDIWAYDDASGTFEKVPSQFSGTQNITLEGYNTCADELMLNISGDWYHYDAEQDSCIFLTQNNSQTYRGGDCIQGKFWYPDYGDNDIKSYDIETGEIQFLKEISDPAPFQPYSIKVIDELLYIWDIASGLPKSLYRYDPVLEVLDTVFQTNEITVEMNTLLFHEGNPYCIADREDWEIFKYDMSDELITSVVDINLANGNGFNNSPPFRFQVFEDRMYFNAISGYGNGFLGSDVWTKGTENGDYELLSDVLNSSDKPYIYDKMIELDDRLYFTASLKDGDIRQLVSYQVGEDSLRWHGNVEDPPGGFNVFLVNMRAYEDRIIFSAFRDFYYSTQFFQFDSNTDEISLLEGMQGFIGEPRFIIDDHLIFTGSDTSQNFVNNLYDFNLQTAEITEIANDTLLLSNWQRIYQSGDKVLYMLKDLDTGDNILQLYDPETAQSSAVLPNGYTSIYPNAPMFFEGKTWFHYNHEDSSKVYTLDPETAQCVEYLNLGLEINIDGEMVWHNGKLFFYGSEPGSSYGSEIYVYDPLTETASLYADINLGPVSSSVGSFFNFDGRLYFIASDGHRGKELWSLSDCFSITMDLNPDEEGLGAGSIDISITGGQEPYTYSWNNGAVTEDISNLSADYYELTVTDATGCQQTAFALLEGSILFSSTKDLSAEQTLLAYPNPAQDVLYVELKQGSVVNAMLFDQYGRLVLQKYPQSGKFDMNLNALKSGMYYLLIQTAEGNRISKKIIVLGL